MRKPPARLWLLLAAVAAACASVSSVSIEPIGSRAAPPEKDVTAFNAEEELTRGHYLEVGRYLERLPDAERRGDVGNLVQAGRVALARGDTVAAREALQSALSRSLAGTRRAETQWALAQAEILDDDFLDAARHAGEAGRGGLVLSPGFVRFLASLSAARLYEGVAPGTRLETGFEMGLYDLIRVPISVNGRSVAAVLDTGASYSIVTRSFAAEAGVREIPDTDAYGLGLHGKPIPLTFGVVDALAIGGARLTTVPVMIMPDEALSFVTARGPLPISAVLGLHLLKDFSLEIAYGERRLALERLPASPRELGSDQNLFFVRGKVMARATVESSPWTLFLLDTGSELTMLTAGGVKRLGVRTATGLYPKRIEGIGNARVSWGKVERLAIGFAGYRFRFRDIVVAETEGSVEDGVLGSSALAHFRVRIDFHRMKLDLEDWARRP